MYSTCNITQRLLYAGSEEYLFLAPLRTGSCWSKSYNAIAACVISVPSARADLASDSWTASLTPGMSSCQKYLADDDLMALTFLVANSAQYLIIISCCAGCLVQQRSHIEQVLDCYSIRSIQALDVQLDPCFGEHALCYRLQKQDPICLSCDVIRNRGSWIIPITGIVVICS
jgi:hypothetical protein